MVVKILKSAKGFSGIDYNEARVKEGEAKLLTTLNFGAVKALFSTMTDYKNYLKSWSARNERIKNPQFHVVLSCKGRSMSGEQLQNIAIRWLKEMGYGKVPAVIYLHSNTKNNHIHIVTSRVGEDGKKISDAFEKERAVRIINKIMEENVSSKMRKAVATALRYSFSSTKQFMMILESQGYKTYENSKDNSITVSYAGERQLISTGLIKFCQIRYKREQETDRLKQISVILKKYSQRMNKEQLVDYLKAKLGVQLVFFGKEGKPYGYAIIDHQNRSVIKGSDVLPIKILLNSIENGQRDFSEIIRGALSGEPYLTIYQLNRTLKKYGVLYRGGEIVRNNSDICVSKVDAELSEKLNENSRAYYCAFKYAPQTIGEITYLSRKYNTNSEAIRLFSESSHAGTLQHYVHLMEDLAESSNPKEMAKYLGIHFERVGEDYLLIDNEQDCVLSTSRLGFSENDIENLIYEEPMNYTEIANYEEQPLMENDEIMGVGLVGSMAGMIHISHGGGGGGNTLPRKKKRRD